MWDHWTSLSCHQFQENPFGRSLVEPTRWLPPLYVVDESTELQSEIVQTYPRFSYVLNVLFRQLCLYTIHKLSGRFSLPIDVNMFLWGKFDNGGVNPWSRRCLGASNAYGKDGNIIWSVCCLYSIHFRNNWTFVLPWIFSIWYLPLSFEYMVHSRRPLGSVIQLSGHLM